ncbi:MAG: hypothetical protein KJO98_06210 [Rhodothermia bacterium]|nr:hypothetical protein [Rhodothermia bacterium]
MAAKKYPLPKRFSLALSEKAYAQLRALNATYRYGNNYLLTVILENFDAITDRDALDKAFTDFKDEFGAPSSAGMKKQS